MTGEKILRFDNVVLFERVISAQELRRILSASKHLSRLHLLLKSVVTLHQTIQEHRYFQERRPVSFNKHFGLQFS